MGQPLQAVRFLETHLRSVPASSGHNRYTKAVGSAALSLWADEPWSDCPPALLCPYGSHQPGRYSTSSIMKTPPIFLTVVMTLTQAKLWS